MRREQIFHYVARRYGTEPDYPWAKTPAYAILRHTGSRKWYAALINPTRRQLGLAGEGRVDVLNLKCAPELAAALRREPGILPGYHMNKEHWITVPLDDSVPQERVLDLLDLSYQLTKPQK